MLGDAVIILANIRGAYVDVGSTVHTLFRMTGRPRKVTKELDRTGGRSDVADAQSDGVEPAR